VPNSVSFGIVHVGDSVSNVLSITNTGIVSGFTENLDAGFISAVGSITLTGSVSSLAASATDNSDLSIGLNTANARYRQRHSRSGIGIGRPLAVDTLGTTALASQTITVTGTVNNYAAAQFTEISGGGTLTQSGTNYTLKPWLTERDLRAADN